MKMNGVNRRDFLRMGLAAGALAGAALAFPKFVLADAKKVSLADCVDMSPEDMALQSKMVTESMQYLERTVATIQDPNMRSVVQTILTDPAPTLMANLMDEKNRKAVYDELRGRKLLPEDMAFADFLPPTKTAQKSPHPFHAAPGSGYASHHAYPGGVASHTAVNVMLSLSLYDHYDKVYGFALDRDVVIASQALHDLHKAWVFQWGPDGESRKELNVAGTGEHHVYSIAESLHRGLPPELVVAQACAHNHPGFAKDEEEPVRWLTAAAILVGKDPVQARLLAEDRKSLPLPRRMEGFVCHLGDHDWILSVPAAKWTIPVMEQIAAEKYGMKEADIKSKKFKQLRNYVFSQVSIMALYEIYSTKGKDALASTVTGIVTPA